MLQKQRFTRNDHLRREKVDQRTKRGDGILISLISHTKDQQQLTIPNLEGCPNGPLPFRCDRPGLPPGLSQWLVYENSLGMPSYIGISCFNHPYVR